MRFVCDSCRAQYMISDDKVGAKGVKVRCKKCGYVILVRKADGETTQVAPMPQTSPAAHESDATGPNALPPEPGSRPGGDPGERYAGNGANGVHANGSAENGQSITSFGGNGQSNNVLGGVEEDEIGAVFDQVLKTGPQKTEPKEESEDVPLGFDDNDDLSSTRVVSAEALRKLAKDSEQFALGGKGNGNGESGAAHGEESGDKPAGDDVPQTDWFVAVDDQQQGPLTLEKLKDLWERGEVGPDSLCWRSGYSDWTALSEVEALKSVLAPKPSKPMIASSPGLVGPGSGAVVTVPVETSFNSGGMSQSVRTEMPVSMAAAGEGAEPAADTGSWQPSAASALASLVKEEMSVLSKPASARSLLGDTGPNEAISARGGGLLDLPSATPAPAGNGHAGNGLLDVPVPAGMPAGPAPSASPAFAQSQYPTYAPPPAHHGLSRPLMIALGVVAFLLIATIGTVLFVFTRTPAAPAATPSAEVARADPQMPPPPAGLKQNPPAPTAAPSAQPATGTPPAAGAPAPTPGTATAPPGPTPAPVASATPPPGPTPAPAPSAVPAPTPAAGRHRLPTGSGSAKDTPLVKPGGGGDEGEVITPGGKGGGGAKSKDDDEFDSLFGGGKKAAPDGPAPGPKKGKSVYIPGETGGGGASDLKESLSSSDVTSTVLNYRPKIVECVQAQKAKQPGATGTLVMKWTILPSGKTAQVSVQTEEFKSTYLANCLTILVKGMSFPKHKVQGEPIVFPFKF
ncbi:MAG TPA: adventurous gliding motility protein GltJ [Myxococcaceae bacterium]|nr:adventurous gliding motility protein GltJ [Myxococcaceae bacterium]